MSVRYQRQLIIVSLQLLNNMEEYLPYRIDTLEEITGHKNINNVYYSEEILILFQKLYQELEGLVGYYSFEFEYKELCKFAVELNELLELRDKNSKYVESFDKIDFDFYNFILMGYRLFNNALGSKIYPNEVAIKIRTVLVAINGIIKFVEEGN